MNSDFLEMIKNAVLQGTGVSFDEFTDPKKSEDTYYARLIFCYQIMHRTMTSYKELAVIVKRHVTGLHKCEETYRIEMKGNKAFREKAEKVNNLLMGKYLFESLLKTTTKDIAE
jgi:hypothetical protein